jgi:two-component system, chemotaxis family, protein-glutamate methylesterase/glutaminase
MILFCEECGTRHDVDEQQVSECGCRFPCKVCNEVLMLTAGNTPGGKTAQAAMASPVLIPPEALTKPLDILVVDDSKIIRKVLREIIESDGRNRVIGEAENGKVALQLLEEISPDVITLDINMPVMDGLTTLKHIMIHHPVPTVMISALTQEGARETFESLKYGAIDFLPKPSRTKGADLQTQKSEILRKIELVAAVQLESIRYLRRPSQEKSSPAAEALPCRCLVTIGVAEGGYGALLNIIPRLSGAMAVAYVAVMPQAPEHVDGFARYLDQCSQLCVQRVAHGTLMRGGTCYLGAATEQVTFVKEHDQIRLIVDTASSCAPGTGAIDNLMGSAAHLMRERAAGVILTGAGDDGVKGLGAILKEGGTAFVQDPRSCLFKETPMKVVDKYIIKNLVSDKQMAAAIESFLVAHTE